MSRVATSAAWLPTGIALLLLVLAGYWLAQALPPMPRLPRPLAEAAPPAPKLESEPLQEIPRDTTVRFGSYDPLEGDTLARPLEYRRYIGTLNGQAVVVQLAVGAKSTPDSWAGRWYYRYARRAGGHRLLFRQQQGDRLVLAEESDIATADTVSREWELGWPLTRELPSRRRRKYGAGGWAAQLREDYSNAVRYELLRLTAHGSYCHFEPGRSQPYYSTEFLHLLGPDSVRLARWQAPPPAARRDSLRKALQMEGSCLQVSQSVEVTLNDYDLLSFNLWTQGYYYGAHPEHGSEGFILDLTTGREWLVEELLRPGTEPALRRLLAKHLRQDYPEMSEEDQWHWKNVPPLPGSFILTPTGLEARYSDYALAAYVASNANTTTIPYAELRPLVRPGTPLARLLAARGLW